MHLAPPYQSPIETSQVGEAVYFEFYSQTSTKQTHFRRQTFTIMNEKILVFSAHIRPFVGSLQIIILQSMNDVLPIFPNLDFLCE